ncbi:MAG: polysaccharide deacetylase family protein [Clostridiales bacterium]|nr:polysaccharide deacetylase family protein [Clostridiales bacterium]
MKKLLILYYHEVVKKGEGAAYQKIEEEKFEEQMRYLQENGYTTLFFSQLDKPLPEKPIIISFDDGFLSVYEKAAPIMRKYGVKGNVYLPTAYIGNDEKFMTWDMVKALQTNKDFEMQAHTHNHVDIRTLSKEDMTEEIQKSQEKFAAELGYLPNAICLPFGTYDRKSLRLLKRSGKYKYVLGSFYGMVRKRKLQKGGLLPRIGVSNTDSMEVFEKKLKGKLNWKGKLQRLRLWLASIRKQRVTKYEY